VTADHPAGGEAWCRRGYGSFGRRQAVGQTRVTPNGDAPDDIRGSADSCQVEVGHIEPPVYDQIDEEPHFWFIADLVAAGLPPARTDPVDEWLQAALALSIGIFLKRPLAPSAIAKGSAV
jgi:hypothetical protein